MKNYLTRQLQQVKQNHRCFYWAFPILTGSTVYADDPFAKSDNLAKQGITKVQLVSVALFGLAVVTSLIYAFGGRELKASMKNWFQLQLQLVFLQVQVSLNGFLILWKLRGGDMALRSLIKVAVRLQMIYFRNLLGRWKRSRGWYWVAWYYRGLDHLSDFSADCKKFALPNISTSRLLFRVETGVWSVSAEK